MSYDEEKNIDESSEFDLSFEEEPDSSNADSYNVKIQKYIIIFSAVLVLVVIAIGSYLFVSSSDDNKYLEGKNLSPRIVMEMPPRRSIKHLKKPLLTPPVETSKEKNPEQHKKISDAEKAKKATLKTEPQKKEVEVLEARKPILKEPVIPFLSMEEIVRDMPSFQALKSFKKAGLQALIEAPLPELQQRIKGGFLPKISLDGKLPWQAYARPFKGNQANPRLAIIIMGLGIDEQATKVAIEVLSSEVTLSFSPYAKNLKELIKQARTAGHEVLIDLPLESKQFPAMDSGPYTLLTLLSKEDNLKRLNFVLSRASGYIGVTGYMGEKFANSPSHMLPIMKELKKRGLVYVDTCKGSAININQDTKLAHAVADIFVDEKKQRISIDARLKYLKDLAKYNGQAIGISTVLPVSFHAINDWVRQFKLSDEEFDKKHGDGAGAKRVLFAPVSAIVTE